MTVESLVEWDAALLVKRVEALEALVRDMDQRLQLLEAQARQAK